MRYLLLFILLCSNYVRGETFDNLILGVPCQADYVINRRGYAVGFSIEYKQPIWIIYKLTKSEVLNKKIKRNKTFNADPEISMSNHLINAYKNSGYDRGHLIPANDFRWSETAMDSCFYISLISPQLSSFNRGLWKQLENLVSKWAIIEEDIFVITGTIFIKKAKFIGEIKIPIPTHFYKIIYDLTPPQKMIAFIIPHENNKKTLINYATTVDNIELITGLNFFSKLSLEKQNILEKSIDITLWNFK